MLLSVYVYRKECMLSSSGDREENINPAKKVEGSLSGVDRAILKVILDTNDGNRSSILLSRKLGVPPTTILRRRKCMEKDFLELSYALNLKKFGWRRVDLLISTKNGKTNSVAKQLLSNEEVVYVSKSIGEHTIDLR